MTPFHLTQLSVFPASDEQTLESRKRTHAQWGRGASLELYLERDRIIEQYEHANNGRLVTWVLAPREDPSTLEFLCSCETYRRTGLRKWVNASDVEEVACYGIASVFTPVKYRNKGYARHMMRLLHWILADSSLLPLSGFPPAWGQPPPNRKSDGAFAVLWSDVGPEFYKACCPKEHESGWVATESRSWVCETKKITTRLHAPLDEWPWIEEHELRAIWDKDTLFLKRSMASRTNEEGVLLSFLPNQGVAAFQYRRAQLFHPDCTCWGVRSHDSEAYATWTIDTPLDPTVQPLTLLVTRLNASPSSFSPLLSKIAEAAAMIKASRIEIWNMPNILLDHVRHLGGQDGDREEHLASMKCYGSGSERVEWMWNEKFCWC